MERDRIKLEVEEDKLVMMKFLKCGDDEIKKQEKIVERQDTIVNNDFFLEYKKIHTHKERKKIIQDLKQD